MKLRKKSASLLDEFKSDAYQVEEPQAAVQAGPAEALSLILEEKVTCYLRKDGGTDGLEVQLRRSRLSFTGHAQSTSESLSSAPASWSRESLNAVLRRPTFQVYEDSLELRSWRSCRRGRGRRPRRGA